VILSPRQTVTLYLLADGMTAQAIAHRLNISPSIVNKHLNAIYRTFGVRDRVSAVPTAEYLGLLPSPNAPTLPRAR
jgi:DNA-binding CsgD family transcriptional regulator